MSDSPDLSPIAVGGCGSSGTSLLRRIMDAHSEIACGKEMSVFDRPRMYEISLDELYRMYRTQNFTRLEENIPFPIVLEDKSSYFGLRRGNNGDTFHSVSETIAIFVRARNVAHFWNLYFTFYAQKQGKQRWAEKTPANIMCAKQFLEMYPDGRFIHMIRDGRDTCLSLIYRRGFEAAAALIRWITCMEAGLELRDHPRFYELRYEKLVHEPETTLTGLFQWLGTQYEPSVLDFHKTPADNRFDYANRPIHQNSLGRWERQKDEIPDVLRELIPLSLRRYLDLMDYPVEK
jgi:hypothetical protein